MPTISDDGWVNDMEGPERLERAKIRRAEQIKRWKNRENNTENNVNRNIHQEKKIKFTPNIVLLDAAARNDLSEVAKLLESGVSPDLGNEDGLTALHQSCIDGCEEMVKYLIEYNANINACDNELWTPLHAAAACGHLSIIRYLIDNGGDILAMNLDGNLPADVVEDDTEVEQFLEREMAKLGYEEEDLEELRLSQGKQLLDDLKDSVENGRSLDIQDWNGATAFHVAAANGWNHIVDFLLENEADFEIADNSGWQPIHAAAAWGHETILEILVASGADLESKTNDLQTPLDLTDEEDIIELIKELKTKQILYPRTGRGVRRKRSNTSNSSIKRLSIHEKCELSHTDSKAYCAALFTQQENSNEEHTDDSSPFKEKPPKQMSDAPTSHIENEQLNYASEHKHDQADQVKETKTFHLKIELKTDSQKIDTKTDDQKWKTKTDDQKIEMKTDDQKIDKTDDQKIDTKQMIRNGRGKQIIRKLTRKQMIRNGRGKQMIRKLTRKQMIRNGR
ncbi:protein phosphatase 1 regulatory subunit 16A-like isoform X6 [Xenia sp. Carnegie-2017]|uniref:protein phosphatase 1 regulatory subunit 16A-like isoform X6 n=2 Tax=Xenia sp. Carnegie-2017 TaxID=2897299 RepID=UPI001F035F32|nr:protein phosphatase 1 regulatory subunit 16A-like isoform X6 [Xenia sp. Carnegie-2017]